MTRTPLTSRPLDLLYFSFFAIHVVASLVVDLQSVYPPHLVPAAFQRLLAFYTQISNDPLMLGLIEQNHHFIWFKIFVYLEAFFQLPVFILGMRGLWKESRSIYVLLLIYAASTTTTTLPCLAVILNTPVTAAGIVPKGSDMISPVQRSLLLSSYIPFFTVPLLMTVDMGARIFRLIQGTSKAQKME